MNVPTPASAMPGTSSRAARALPARPGMYLSATTNAAMPIGRLTMKIERQPLPSRSMSTSVPPMIGPSTADRPMTGPNVPQTLPISEGGNRSFMRPKPWGSIIAPNTPCSTRDPISMSGDCATAHDSEASVKPPIPTSSIRLRPKMSPSRPPVSSSTARASV